MPFQIKRIYDSPQVTDGTRVLVDRLWPRGVKKSAAHLDHWMKTVAPSPALRVWFGHLPARFRVSSQRYSRELENNACLDELRQLGLGRQVTLLYAARDPNINHALVLKVVLDKVRAQTTRRSLHGLQKIRSAPTVKAE